MSELDEFQDGSDEEGEEMTADEVLHKLEEAWRNEKFSPDLLEAKMDLVECMLEQLVEMEENIKRAKRTDVRVSIHRMEIDRIRYIISSYLRCRLQKVERYTVHILEQERQRKEEDSCRMSPEEFVFAKDYAETMDSHFRSLALRHMPPNLQTLDTKQTAVRPNMDKYVFLQVNEDTEGVLVEEETLETGEEIVDLQKGDQHIMQYKPIAPLVASGAVTLI
ncbi:DNA replication complex GINS protein SLD5-like [Argopecten irradians]|uniref:DNA replication complex GINS protein SLD5-like n=1 Tax=Argopecten irradians TaxID=31199 RepID=UPI00371B255F